MAYARKDGKINVEAPVYANLISAFDYLEGQNRSLFNHGWINFPLAYTQVNIRSKIVTERNFIANTRNVIM